MNDRIKELIEQATERYLDWGGTRVLTEFNKEMFAKLIIQECIEIVEPCKCGCVEGSDEVGSALRETVELIKKHFGVV